MKHDYPDPSQIIPFFEGPADEDKEPARTIRLTGQLKRVYDVMRDGEWRTLSDIGFLASAPEASVSAQLRHLRKPRFGGHQVEKRHRRRGLYQYRMVVNERK